MPTTTRLLKFTDTLADINGVCRFIQNIAQSGRENNKQLRVFTSTRMTMPEGENLVNFEPIFARKMPGYDTLDLAIPPLIKMLRAADEFRPDVIHISTPGPVGMVGLLAAKIMRVPVVGVYHTDFPAYIDEFFDNRAASSAIRLLMGTFYRQFRFVFSRSADYADRLAEMGIHRHKLARLTPGFDDTRFDAALRDPGIWDQFGISRESIKLVFCGRVSTEKNLPMLEAIWPTILDRAQRFGVHTDLIIIGDGPYRTKMEANLKDTPAHFLGFRNGKELAALYSSCDVFVFPSTTDTLGQVVMESQCSGLPVIATDQGGPKEIIEYTNENQRTGFVLPIDNHDRWIETITDLILDENKRKAMGRAGIELMKSYTFAQSFEHYWHMHEQAAFSES